MLLFAGIVFWGAALLMWKGSALFELSKTSARRRSLLFLGCGTVAFVGGGALIGNALYLRVDPRSVADLEFTRIDKEQGAAVGAPRVVSDTGQIQRAFALLSKARQHFRSGESCRKGYLIRLRLRGEPDFSGRLIFAYRSSGSGGDASIVVPSVSRRTSGALVDAGEYEVPEFDAWLARTVDPLFMGPSETRNGQ